LGKRKSGFRYRLKSSKDCPGSRATRDEEEKEGRNTRVCVKEKERKKRRRRWRIKAVDLFPARRCLILWGSKISGETRAEGGSHRERSPFLYKTNIERYCIKEI